MDHYIDVFIEIYYVTHIPFIRGYGAGYQPCCKSVIIQPSSKVFDMNGWPSNI